MTVPIPFRPGNPLAKVAQTGFQSTQMRWQNPDVGNRLGLASGSSGDLSDEHAPALLTLRALEVGWTENEA
jgi:hypothetical protein